jgi:very-short-patch-repair endonuclease
MPRKRQDRNVARARTLRREMSLPEVLLWNLLRKSPGGVHFRRQHPMARYVLDFYCAEAKTCFEIDGLSHDAGDRPERDQQRDAWLKQQGVEVLRISAADVLKSPEDIAEGIVRHCQR